MGPKLARSLSCQAAEANKLEVQHDKQFMFMEQPNVSTSFAPSHRLPRGAFQQSRYALSGKHFEMNSFESKW